MKKILYAVILLLCVSMVTSTMNSCKKNTDAVENNGGSNNGGSNNGGGNNGGGNGGGGNGTYNGHDYVDLGLPSGTLWATCNVGATTPAGFGKYYAWAETTTKSLYDWSTYKYCNGSEDYMTKYNSNDHLTILQSSDDAATANWGSGWRTPTKEELTELYQYTSHDMAFQNNVKGYKFTSTNGNTLFLPAAGCDFADDCGMYWTSSVSLDKSYKAWCFAYSGNMTLINERSREHGFTIRPVRATH